MDASRTALGRKAILITTTKRWPLSARLAAQMVGHGGEVSALCPHGHFLNKVSGIASVYSYSGGLDPVAILARAIDASAPDLIVPSDDLAVWHLHTLYERQASLRGLISTSLGDPSFFPILRSRAQIMRKAGEMGIRIPETGLLSSEPDVIEWFRRIPEPATIKLDGTSSGSGVQVVSGAEETICALRRFAAPETAKTRMRRWLVERDPLPLCWRGLSQPRMVSIQRWISGHSATSMIAAWKGKVLGIVSAEVLCTQYPTGPSTVVRLIQDEEIAAAATKFAAELRLSGFYGFDFIVEEATGSPYLIEINPRCTQLGHLVLPTQGDLAGLLCHQLGLPNQRPSGSPVEKDVIAFFPQALVWNPDSPLMQTCHHDVPWEQPDLVVELLRKPFAERQWLSRAYRWSRRMEGTPMPSVERFMRVALENGFISYTTPGLFEPM